ncbi:acyltransferase [Fontivita pretiosa]|uniref:acyltransferase n=1 Tax=Fontivita pretiosa TaxID=2989684 RepID=UPI003D176249
MCSLSLDGRATIAPGYDTASGADLRSRDLGFDSVRLLASIAIVWAHSPRSDQIMWLQVLGVFGTSFFAAASVYFLAQGLRRDADRTLGRYALSRARRLYVPFLVWSIVYLIFRNLCRALITHKPTVQVTAMNLLAGGETHLWFLPFILIVCLVAFPLLRFALARPHRPAPIALAFAVGGLLLVVLPPPRFAPESDTVNFWRCAYWAMPSVLWGLAIALSDDVIRQLRDGAPRTTLLAAGITVTCLALLVTDGLSIYGKNIAGVACMLVALSLPRGNWQRSIAPIATLGFGVYLVHPLVLGVLRAGSQLVHLHPGPWLDLTHFALAVGFSLALARLIQQTRWLRWLVP